MPAASTRQRLTQAALELFLSQGISHTTTRQIADRAGVNEATLFRNFGNKYGLFLAMLQDSAAADGGSKVLPVQASTADLRSYASDCLQLLDQVSNFVRSIIGEADQYPPEHRQALQACLGTIRQDMAQHLEQLLGKRQMQLPPAEMASLLGTLLLGYTLVESASGYPLWDNRETFLDVLVNVLTGEGDANAVGSGDGLKLVVEAEAQPVEPAQVAPETAPESAAATSESTAAGLLIELPAVWVHQMLKQARSLSPQDGALAFVLFGAGLLPAEIILLEKAHQICDKSQHVLQVMGPGIPRQVPVNQWILGKRYGSYTSNPLTKWLKGRKDESAALFIDEAGDPMTVATIQARWDLWQQSLETGALYPQPAQAHQTWCVEMLMRGMTLENLSILTGQPVADLQAYAQRARQKAAIAAATELDRKAPGSAG